MKKFCDCNSAGWNKDGDMTYDDITDNEYVVVTPDKTLKECRKCAYNQWYNPLYENRQFDKKRKQREIKMGRPRKAVRSIEKNISIPEDICARLDLHLFSVLEQRVPHGAWSRYITGLIIQDLSGRK